MSLIDLIMSISEAESQNLKNELIKELTYRQYVPFKDKTFEEMLVENGYKVIEEEKNKKI